jgi:hypothetical protein
MGEDMAHPGYVAIGDVTASGSPRPPAQPVGYRRVVAEAQRDSNK